MKQQRQASLNNLLITDRKQGMELGQGGEKKQTLFADQNVYFTFYYFFLCIELNFKTAKLS